MDIETEVKEEDLRVTLQLDLDNRIVAMDCTYLETDNVVILKRKDLPMVYNKFAKVMDTYKYLDGAFVLSPYMEIPTAEEVQNDINIDVDYRLSLLEMGV